MATAQILLADGSTISDVAVPEWLAPHIVDYLAAVTAAGIAAAEVATATAAHAVTAAALLVKQQAFASTQQTLNYNMAAIAANIGGN